MIVDKENIQLLGQQKRPFLKHQVDCFKHQIRNLILSADHRDERSTDLVVVCTDGLGTGQIVHVSDDESNGGQSDS